MINLTQTTTTTYAYSDQVIDMLYKYEFLPVFAKTFTCNTKRIYLTFNPLIKDCFCGCYGRTVPEEYAWLCNCFHKCVWTLNNCVILPRPTIPPNSARYICALDQTPFISLSPIYWHIRYKIIPNEHTEACLSTFVTTLSTLNGSAPGIFAGRSYPQANPEWVYTNYKSPSIANLLHISFDTSGSTVRSLKNHFMNTSNYIHGEVLTISNRNGDLLFNEPLSSCLLDKNFKFIEDKFKILEFKLTMPGPLLQIYWKYEYDDVYKELFSLSLPSINLYENEVLYCGYSYTSPVISNFEFRSSPLHVDVFSVNGVEYGTLTTETIPMTPLSGTELKLYDKFKTLPNIQITKK